MVHYTFPLDAVYEVQPGTGPQRAHVELLAPHQVELMLDGERVRLLLVEPPPSGMDHHLVEKDSTSVPVKAGPHVPSHF